jgi:hypothetical protein
LYITSDIAFAAYLLMTGYELLGAIDTGTPRKEFGITHTDPEVLAQMEIDVKTKADEFERSDVRVYYRKFQELKHSLDEPIRRPE